MGDLADLQESIKYCEEALASTPQNHPDRADRYGNLGEMFLTRFERIGDLGDLQKAIEHSEAALDATPQDHSNRAQKQDNLAATLSVRYCRMGGLDDLQKAIENSEEALAATPLDHRSRVSRQHNLGCCFGRRFTRKGDLNDLQEAIKHGEEALAASAPGDPSRPATLSVLGSWLSDRFKRLGNLGDLEQGIKHSKEALDATPQDHPDRPCRWYGLGLLLSHRFERIGDILDLQKGIKHSEEALAAIPHDHPLRAAMHHLLASNLATRFRRIGDLDDLHKAIKNSEDGLASTPQDHPIRVSMQNNLGTSFLTRFQRIGDFSDLGEAVKHGEGALAATPEDHPLRATVCAALGGLFESRFSIVSTPEDFDQSLRLYREAFDCQTSPPGARIEAARRAASLLSSNGNFDESSSLLEKAVSLMSSVNLRLLRRDDQQHILSQLSGVASTAASVALLARRDAYDSLKLLELGRGIIIGFAIDSRSEVSDLRTDHPLEFSQFDSLRLEIDSPIEETNYASDETPDRYRNRVMQRRWEAVNEMEESLARIRMLPGYDGFLLSPTREDLMKSAINGAIIIFNCTGYRSDAIIVTTSAITSLELPKLNYEETADWMRQLANFGGGGWIKRGKDNRKIKDLLIWLWDSAVGPVFDKLEHDGTIVSDGVQGSNLKRVWWIGVGKLSMAPFHAAGDHSPGSTRNTLSRAISSYIPTIKALTYARQKKLELFHKYGASVTMEHSKTAKILKQRNARLLLIPMAETPGATSLPGVDAEVQHILDSTTKTPVETTVLKNPNPAEVLKQFQHHDIVHFSCHGVSSINPSDSHLLLFDPDGEGASKLLARDISGLVAQNAQLAYLSACSSAKNSSVILADEVIHLASAFQLAGFSHTLANLWETDDHASSEVARDFYHLLFQNQENGDGHNLVSAAFHKAVKKCRDRKPGDFLTWAPFVHTGA
ncbi:unnamed protein product, partial [Tuber aestivum]